ncbi:hypothetical protein RHODO2019_10790 [Rhodococcus antarcticus]|uniref:Uncharacterized protein n=1 Tax=Rhodococcus antarcticus TaxID=2987751 RepID=A0ABY6NWC2_9NOCA|nr:hypothetical protein [Rhodococcus antarcticus]UZJ23694.1 hypothetical protein RHODO2019_10790 [Rhodococcus antarcticus]
MSDTAETIYSEDSRFRARLVYDDDPMSPRDGDTGVWLYTVEFDGRVGEYVYDSLDRDEDLSSTLGGAVGRGMDRDSLPRYLWLVEGRRALTMSSPHRSGPDLLWVEDDARLAEVTQYPTTLAERDAYLVAVAGEYRSWAEGDVYGIVVEHATTWDDDVDEPSDYVEVESCWGFIGLPYALVEARDMLAGAVEDDVAPRFGQLTFASAV